MRLKDKVIVIIGASGGIGAVLARVFHAEGATVVLSARTESKLLALADSLGSGDRVWPYAVDATIPSELGALFEAVKKRKKQIDAVVISAGSWARLSVNNSLKEAEDLISEHFRGIFRPPFIAGFVAQKFFREQGHGWIINISSHAATKPGLVGNLTYGPMKAAARHFVLGLQQELSGTGVRVSDLQPAIVNTLDNQRALDTPKKRAAAVQPEDIAEWIITYFDDERPPAEEEFESEVVLD